MQTNQTEAQQMAAALLAYLNQLEILPVNIALERAEERPAAVMTLREEPAYRRYDLAGGYKAQFPFAVSYCLTPDGQAQRLRPSRRCAGWESGWRQPSRPKRAWHWARDDVP